MQAPTRADYVRVYFTLFERFQQERGKDIHYGHPFEYADRVLIVFFTMMSIRRITAFQAQHRWLTQHWQEAMVLGFEQIPHRITLSRRYKTLYPTVQALVAFVGGWVEALHPEFDSRVLVEDASLFKACGLASSGSLGGECSRKTAQLGSGSQLAQKCLSWLGLWL